MELTRGRSVDQWYIDPEHSTLYTYGADNAGKIVVKERCHGQPKLCGQVLGHERFQHDETADKLIRGHGALHFMYLHQRLTLSNQTGRRRALDFLSDAAHVVYLTTFVHIKYETRKLSAFVPPSEPLFWGLSSSLVLGQRDGTCRSRVTTIVITAQSHCALCPLLLDGGLNTPATTA